MTERKKQRVLIDAGVLLEHPNIITEIRVKGHWPVILAEAMTRLMECRTYSTSQGRNADHVLSQIEGSQAFVIKSFPTGEALQAGDHLAQFQYAGAPAFLFKRQHHSAESAVARTMEVASHYGMTLVTCDDQVARLAAGAKIVCFKWPLEDRGPALKETSLPAKPEKAAPFNVFKTPLSSPDIKLAAKAFPSANDMVFTSKGERVRLGQKLSEGGEGVIYETSSSGSVCKIYHPDKLTSLKRQKIELMVTRTIEQPGICWPSALIFNHHAEFVGYLMPRAQGKTIQGSMFVKPLLLKTFPTWQRIDLVNLCLAFLEQIRYLHSLNILVGDINPQNLLITQDSNRLWLADTDSFQVEAFPCPVGTVNFTAPEIQGRGYESFLRTTQHELFAVATMLFMILFPGKPPYSQQGGGSPAENIKAKKFPYRDFSDKENFSGENAPQGSWGIIWNHLSKDMRAAFHRTFSRDERLTVEEWIKLLGRYQYSIKKQWCGNEIFPTSYFFIRDPIEVACGRCGARITTSQKYATAQANRGMKVWCQDCHKQHRLKRMAEQSYKEGLEAERKQRGRPAPAPPIARPTPSPSIRPAAAPHPMPVTAPAAPRPAPQPFLGSGRPVASPPRVAPQSPAPSRQPQSAQPRAKPKPASHPPFISRAARLVRKLWFAIFFK